MVVVIYEMSNDSKQVKLQGNTPANNILSSSKNDGLETGTFLGSHLIASGLKSIFEGDTVCFPEKITPKLKVFAQSTVRRITT